MGNGFSSLRWLLQPFTAGMTSAPVRPDGRRHDRATRILAEATVAQPLDADTQARVDGFVARLIHDYAPAAFDIETTVEAVGDAADEQQVILLYPKGRRHDGASRRCEELTAASLPAGASSLQRQQVAAVAHQMLRQIHQRLRDDAGWVDAELEAGLTLGFPADWRDYRFVG